jgi:hypothetical protein
MLAIGKRLGWSFSQTFQVCWMKMVVLAVFTVWERLTVGVLLAEYIPAPVRSNFFSLNRFPTDTGRRPWWQFDQNVIK